MKEGVFVGVHIHQFLDYEDLEVTIDELELAAWHAFKYIFLEKQQRLIENA